MELEYEDHTSSGEKNEEDSRMTADSGQAFVPTEQSVITLFQKTAASSPGTTGRETVRHPATGSTHHHHGNLLV
jgi:hypothetical protein